MLCGNRSSRAWKGAIVTRLRTLIIILALAFGLSAMTVQAQDPFNAEKSDCGRLILEHRFSRYVADDLPEGIYYLMMWVNDRETDPKGSMVYYLSSEGVQYIMENPNPAYHPDHPDYTYYWMIFHHEGPIYLSFNADNWFYELAGVEWVFELRSVPPCPKPNDAGR